jgi:SLT domain-containing protein
LTTISSRESSYNAPGQQVGEVSGDVNNNGPILSDGAHANASRGGWQVTPSNFAQFHQPGTSDDIYDPTANAASAINYIQSRYHVSDDGSNLTANVQQADPSRDPHWY